MFPSPTWHSPSSDVRRRGTGFHTPDKDHVHHRLLRLGHGPRRTVAILWAWTAVLSAFLLLPLFDKRANAVILIGIIVLGLALYTLFHPGLRKDTMNGNGAVKTEALPGKVAPPGPPRNGSSPTLEDVAVKTAREHGQNGENGENGTRSGGSDFPRAATPVTHAASRVKGHAVDPGISLQSANSGWFGLVLPRSRGGCEDCGVRFPLPVGSDERSPAMVAVGASAGHTE